MSSEDRRPEAEKRKVSYATAELFMKLFCYDRSHYPYLLMTSDGWKQIKERWGIGLIMEHLQGEIVVGLFPSDLINYLMFDIDNHDEDPKVSLEIRAKSVINLYDTDPLIFTSSESGGIRVCYFLNERYPKKQLREFAEQKLKDVGLEVRDGFIEIMATTKADRLPFGQGSYLVDPITLEPIRHLGLADMVERAWELYELNRLSLDIISEVASHTGKVVHRNLFLISVENLILNGLSEDTSTNDALLKLNWYLRTICGESAEDAESYLISWVHRKHNGNSNRINSRKIKEVEEHIKRIVKAYNTGKVAFQGLRGFDRKLTVGDVARITEMFSEYRQQLAAFSLLEYVKNRGMSVTPESCKAEQPGDVLKTYTSNLYIPANQQVWECEIPYLAFQHFAGFNKASPRDTCKVLLEDGLIKLKSLEIRKEHKCRSYLIFFTYDCDSDDVVSLDEGLRKLCSKKDLKKVYTRYRGDKILKGVCDE